MNNEIINIEAPSFGMSGEFKFTLYDQDEGGNLTVVDERDWSDNVIVDNGLITPTTSSSWHTHFTLGSDGTAATTSDTSIGSFLGNSATTQGPTIDVNAGAPNYEFNETITTRFIVGIETGTIREVVVGENNTGTNIFCRHVISPEITKAANQVLDVSYRLTLWPNLIDINSTATIEGIGYTTITRGLEYAKAFGSVFTQWGPDTWYVLWYVYDGDLGLITDNVPQGNQSTTTVYGEWGGGGSLVAGVSGYRDMWVKYGLNDGNLVAGIRTAMCGTKWSRKFQTQFNADGTGGSTLDDPIPKDETKELTINYRQTWTRH